MPEPKFNMNNPAPTQNPIAGMDISGLVQIRDSLWNAIPPGAVRDALKNVKSGSLLDALKIIPSIFSGRKYRTDQYRLIERFMDNIVGEGNSIGSYKEAPDDLYDIANLFFTAILGVRVTSDWDLYALYDGPDAYYARPGMQDVPREAVNRAVYLMKNFYNPWTTFNVSRWDLRHIADMPLVAPIPDPREGYTGYYYSGSLPGGGVVKNGIIMGSPIVATDTNVNDPVTGQQSGAKIFAGTSWLLIALIVLGVLGWFFFGRKKK